MPRSLLAAIACLALAGAARADAFDEYTNPLLNKAVASDAVKELKQVTSDDLLNVSTALMARAINREVPITLRMFNQNLIARLGSAVENVYALSTSALTAPVLALIAQKVLKDAERHGAYRSFGC